jgi:hypothetical protein
MPQYLTAEIVLTTIATLPARDIVHDKQLVIVLVDILGLRRLKLFMATERTLGIHYARRLLFSLSPISPG